MLGLAFVAVGSFCRRSFASASTRSPFRLFLPLRRCPFLSSEEWDEGAGRGGWGVLGCPCVASRSSSSPPTRLWSSGRGGGASGRSFGARELASVSSVHSWTGDPGVALLRRPPATCSVPVGSPSSSARSAR